MSGLKESEIRIGNYFSHNGEWNSQNHKGVFQWSFNDWYALSESRLLLEDVSPIEITEDVMLECGGHKNDVDKIIRIEKFGFQIAFEQDMGCFLEGIGIEIYYLHQLQNLYFSITGEELTYTPKQK